MSDTIRTKIYTYRFDLDKPEDSEAWSELQERLSAQGLTCFSAISTDRGYDWCKMLDSISGQTIELETKHLFKNQWNTASISGVSEQGLRVFDWARDIVDNRSMMVGHYLEQTDEMREVRRNTLKCGYCGKQEAAAKGYVFCPHCLDSQYLTEEQLLKGATRLVPVDQGHNWTELSQAERDHLLPQYREAQIHGSTERGKERLAKQRRDIEEKYKKETANAKIERDGLIWLMDNGLSIDNVIYYDHKQMFSFGWRNPVSASVRDRILELISEFPFEYEIKAEDKVYSGRE